ncbi:MAG: hypothetical protein VXY16_07950 [Pseudomonadota bacterium]|nr:hypothetical protein [Pseudomonadota bacterium]
MLKDVELKSGSEKQFKRATKIFECCIGVIILLFFVYHAFASTILLYKPTVIWGYTAVFLVILFTWFIIKQLTISLKSIKSVKGKVFEEGSIRGAQIMLAILIPIFGWLALTGSIGILATKYAGNKSAQTVIITKLGGKYKKNCKFLVQLDLPKEYVTGENFYQSRICMTYDVYKELDTGDEVTLKAKESLLGVIVTNYKIKTDNI